MEVESRVAFLPRLNLVMFMSGIVVADDVNFFALGNRSADEIEEPNPLLMAVLLHAVANDAAIGDVEGSKQRSGAIAFVVVRHGRTAALLQRQTRLGSVQSLNLAFLIAREHDG